MNEKRDLLNATEGAARSRSDEATSILCPECGTIVEIHDVRALILTLHLRNDCDISGLFSHGSGE